MQPSVLTFDVSTSAAATSNRTLPDTSILLSHCMRSASGSRPRRGILFRTLTIQIPIDFFEPKTLRACAASRTRSARCHNFLSRHRQSPLSAQVRKRATPKCNPRRSMYTSRELLSTQGGSARPTMPCQQRQNGPESFEQEAVRLCQDARVIAGNRRAAFQPLVRDLRADALIRQEPANIFTSTCASIVTMRPGRE